MEATVVEEEAKTCFPLEGQKGKVKTPNFVDKNEEEATKEGKTKVFSASALWLFLKHIKRFVSEERRGYLEETFSKNQVFQYSDKQRLETLGVIEKHLGKKIFQEALLFSTSSTKKVIDAIREELEEFGSFPQQEAVFRIINFHSDDSILSIEDHLVDLLSKIQSIDSNLLKQCSERIKGLNLQSKLQNNFSETPTERKSPLDIYAKTAKWKLNQKQAKIEVLERKLEKEQRNNIEKQKMQEQIVKNMQDQLRTARSSNKTMKAYKEKIREQEEKHGEIVKKLRDQLFVAKDKISLEFRKTQEAIDLRKKAEKSYNEKVKAYDILQEKLSQTMRKQQNHRDEVRGVQDRVRKQRKGLIESTKQLQSDFKKKQEEIDEMKDKIKAIETKNGRLLSAARTREEQLKRHLKRARAEIKSFNNDSQKNNNLTKHEQIELETERKQNTFLTRKLREAQSDCETERLLRIESTKEHEKERSGFIQTVTKQKTELLNLKQEAENEIWDHQNTKARLNALEKNIERIRQSHQHHMRILEEEKSALTKLLEKERTYHQYTVELLEKERKIRDHEHSFSNLKMISKNDHLDKKIKERKSTADKVLEYVKNDLPIKYVGIKEKCVQEVQSIRILRITKSSQREFSLRAQVCEAERENKDFGDINKQISKELQHAKDEIKILEELIREKQIAETQHIKQLTSLKIDLLLKSRKLQEAEKAFEEYKLITVEEKLRPKGEKGCIENAFVETNVSADASTNTIHSFKYFENTSLQKGMALMFKKKLEESRAELETMNQLLKESEEKERIKEDEYRKSVSRIKTNTRIEIQSIQELLFQEESCHSRTKIQLAEERKHNEIKSKVNNTETEISHEFINIHQKDLFKAVATILNKPLKRLRRNQHSFGGFRREPLWKDGIVSLIDVQRSKWKPGLIQLFSQCTERENKYKHGLINLIDIKRKWNLGLLYLVDDFHDYERDDLTQELFIDLKSFIISFLKKYELPNALQKPAKTKIAKITKKVVFAEPPVTEVYLPFIENPFLPNYYERKEVKQSDRVTTQDLSKQRSKSDTISRRNERYMGTFHESSSRCDVSNTKATGLGHSEYTSTNIFETKEKTLAQLKNRHQNSTNFDISSSGKRTACKQKNSLSQYHESEPHPSQPLNAKAQAEPNNLHPQMKNQIIENDFMSNFNSYMIEQNEPFLKADENKSMTTKLAQPKLKRRLSSMFRRFSSSGEANTQKKKESGITASEKEDKKSKAKEINQKNQKMKELININLGRYV